MGTGFVKFIHDTYTVDVGLHTWKYLIAKLNYLETEKKKARKILK